MKRLLAADRDRRRALLALALVAIVYGLVLARLPGHVFWSPDEGGKVLQLLNLRWEGELAYGLPYPGRVLDPEFDLMPHMMALVDDGTIYSWWPIWFPLLSWPGYTLLGTYGLYLLPLAAGLLCSWLAYLLVRRYAPTWAPLAIPLVGLGTPIFFYSLTFWEHTAAIALGLAGLLLLPKEGQPKGRAATAGLLLAGATILRPEMLLLPAAVLVLLLREAWRERKGRQAAAFLLGCLVGVLPYFGFNLAVEGPLLGRRYGGPALSQTTAVERIFEGKQQNASNAQPATRLFAYARNKGLQLIPNLIVGSAERQGPVLPGWLRWGGAWLFVACLLLPWWPSRWPTWPIYVLYSALLAFCVVLLAWPVPYQAFHGLLIAPQIVFATWAWRRRPPPTGRLLSVTALVTLLFVAAMLALGWEAAGGLQWGPRYLLLLFPLGSVLALLGIASLKQTIEDAELQRFVLSCFAFLFLVGVAFQARGLRTMGQEKERIAGWAAEIEERPRGALVTNLPWLPGVLPFQYAEQDWYVFYEAAGLEQWLERAAATNVERACYAGLTPLSAVLNPETAGWHEESSEAKDGLWIECVQR